MADNFIKAAERLKEALGMSLSSPPPPSLLQKKLDAAQQLAKLQAEWCNVGLRGVGIAGATAGGISSLAAALQQAQVSPAQNVEQKKVDQQKAISTLADRITQLRDAPAIKITSRIPDLVGTITAWRGWKLVDGKLCALGMTGVWEPKKMVKATCTSNKALSGLAGVPHDAPHDAPAKDCKCGYWSFRTMELLQQVLDPYATSVQVIGSVELWGKVVECENGFRSEFAYPKELWLLEEGLEHLSWVYGVPVRRIGQ